MIKIEVKSFLRSKTGVVYLGNTAEEKRKGGREGDVIFLKKTLKKLILATLNKK